MHTIRIEDPAALKQAIEFALAEGCYDQFAQDFCRLLAVMTGLMSASETPLIGEIRKDFAPHSFSFCVWRKAQRRDTVMLNGGLIYAGPGAPGDGRGPSFSVDLAWVAGNRPRHSWNVHT